MRVRDFQQWIASQVEAHGEGVLDLPLVIALGDLEFVPVEQADIENGAGVSLLSILNTDDDEGFEEWQEGLDRDLRAVGFVPLDEAQMLDEAKHLGPDE